MTAPQINPGEIANWPLLKVVYRTDPDRIAGPPAAGHHAGRRARTCTSTSTACR